MVSLASESFKMSIEIKGNPAPTAKFYKNGKEIIEDDRIKFLTADNFHLIKISDTKLTDSGTYSVIANNEISQASEFWQFTVSSPPTLIKSLDEMIIVEEREDIELIIKVNEFCLINTYVPVYLIFFKEYAGLKYFLNIILE